MELMKSLEYFLRDKHALNTAQSTLATYKNHCFGYISFCEERGYSDVESGCSEARYYDYIRYLIDDRKIKDITVASYMRSVKTWFNWMMEKGWIEKYHMPIPKYQETLRETYSDEELSLLLARPQSGCTEVEYITWVMINILIATGMRLGSLKSLRVRDFSYNELQLRVNTTKNNLPIPLPINSELGSILIDYIARLHLKPDDYMFSSGTGSKYASRTIQDYIEQYLSRKRIIKARKVHAFRHTFAKNYYLETHDVYKLKEILGHRDLSMTEHYIRTLGCALTETIEYNPQKKHVLDMPVEHHAKRRRCIDFGDLDLNSTSDTF
ncbi:MAG: site-specific integrase [Lachnospiraceae bacterium]|nr:site-specific integrase [Lachnospiraceae bacterium]